VDDELLIFVDVKSLFDAFCKAAEMNPNEMKGLK
jgi:hypothetical protein